MRSTLQHKEHENSTKTQLTNSCSVRKSRNLESEPSQKEREGKKKELETK